MGLVYRAHDTELDRTVAVKCLLDADRQGMRELATKEARTLASLSHPNIMRVFDILSGRDQVWIVSEWLQGQSIAQLPMPLPPEYVLAIMSQIYDALAAAHDAQVIHRDLKPSNVMIGKDGRVTLIDFGVAFAPGTSTGETLAGSLRYTDPRILEGEAPDAESDMYSAALFLAELMTGEPVLPDLAPLPLYRHIKRHLADRLETLLDGCYPPLMALVFRATSRQCRGRKYERTPVTAREAADLALEALRRISQKPARTYLADLLCAGIESDPAAPAALAAEATGQLQSGKLTPRQQAAWMSFQESLGAPNDTPPRPPARIFSKRSRRRRRRIPRRLAAGLVGAASTAAVIFAVIFGLALYHRRSSIKAWIESPPSSSAPQASTNPAGAEATAEVRPRDGVAPRPPGTDAPIPPQEAPVAGGGTLVPVYLVADAWARVTIDGLAMGQLPLAAPFMLAPGRHSLVLDNPMVQTHSRELVVREGTPARFRVHLEPKLAKRSLVLKQSGRLFVDGKDEGTVRVKHLRLTYGTHQVWVQRGSKIGGVSNIVLTPQSPKEIKLE